MANDGFARVVPTKEGEGKDKGRRNSFVNGQKLIRTFIYQSDFKDNFSLLVFFLPIARDHPPMRPGRSPTPIFMLRAYNT